MTRVVWTRLVGRGEEDPPLVNELINRGVAEKPGAARPEAEAKGGGAGVKSFRKASILSAGPGRERPGIEKSMVFN